jgi:hypothetical protein
MVPAQLSESASADSDNQYDAPHCVVRGRARGSRFQPDGCSLWRVLGDLEADTELHWDTEHGVEALFVLAGALESDGTLITEGSTLLAEAGMPTIVRSLVSTRSCILGTARPPCSATYCRQKPPQIAVGSTWCEPRMRHRSARTTPFRSHTSVMAPVRRVASRSCSFTEAAWPTATRRHLTSTPRMKSSMCSRVNSA